MELFELVENTEKQAIVKVKPLNNILIAKYPYLSKDMDYINITKGRNHILTIIYKDGHTFNFEFGESGYTLVSESLNTLKSTVIDFLRKNNVYIDITTFNLPCEISVYSCNADLTSYFVCIEYGKGQVIKKGFDTKKQAMDYVNEHFETEIIRQMNQYAAAYDITRLEVVSGNILAGRLEL